MTAAAKRTLASTPARLRWRHGTARTRLDVYITETPQGHAPHGRVKRSRRRLPLCSVRGPAGKGGDFPRHRHHFRIFARASAMLRISSRASRKTPAEYSGQTSGGAVHPVYAAHHRPSHWPRYAPHTHWQALMES